MTPLDRLLAKLPNTKKTTKGWSARCPAHEDKSPSLSISEGDVGQSPPDIQVDRFLDCEDTLYNGEAFLVILFLH